MSVIYLRKNSTLACFTQFKKNNRTARYITYFKVAGDSFEKIDSRKVSKLNGNNAFKKLVGNGYVVVAKKVIEE